MIPIKILLDVENNGLFGKMSCPFQDQLCEAKVCSCPGCSDEVPPLSQREIKYFEELNIGDSYSDVVKYLIDHIRWLEKQAGISN